MTDSPYEILGVSKEATEREIQAAYRAKAKHAHPDAGGGVDDFNRIKDAVKLLLDPEKRKLFDAHGIVGENKPDIRESTALERVGHFFITSINATSGESPHDNPLDLDKLDLVQGGTLFFDQEAYNAQRQMDSLNRQVKQFERAIRRLKNKKKETNRLATMLNHHIAGLKLNIVHFENEVFIFKRAIEIISDYEFEQEPFPYQTYMGITRYRT